MGKGCKIPGIFKFIFVSLSGFFCSILAYLTMYHYLELNDNPIICDAVILFVGPSYQTRLSEAYELLNEGYSNTLIIPAYRRLAVIENGEKVSEMKSSDFRRARTDYPKYYERTHIEVLEAKKIMDELGFASAIMVSAPGHMRRIKIISSKVFDLEKYDIRYIGSRYSKRESLFSILNWSHIQFVLLEYVKIFSFFVYGYAI